MENGHCFFCETEMEKQREQVEKAIIMLGSKKAWEDYTINKFIPSKVNGLALEACMKFNPKDSNIYLFGPCGTGKSHLAGIAKRPWVIRGVYTKTVEMDDVSSEQRACFKSPRQAKDNIDTLASIPILSIEDLGVEKDTEFSINLLYHVVNNRYLAKRNGLILTSNYSLDWIAMRHTNERASSRLQEMCCGNIYDLTGEPDHRKEGK